MKNNNTIKLSVLEERLENMSQSAKLDREQNFKEHQTLLNGVEEVKDKIDEKFVTVDRFAPVEKIAYGTVGAFGLAVIGGLIAAFFKIKP